jgi:hypothetical protein
LYNTRLKHSKTHENADEKETGVHGGSGGGGGGGAERRREEFKNGGQAAAPSLFSSLSYQTLTAASFSSSLLFSRFLRLLSR